jgi:hypothetical protein
MMGTRQVTWGTDYRKGQKVVSFCLECDLIIQERSVKTKHGIKKSEKVHIKMTGRCREWLKC